MKIKRTATINQPSQDKYIKIWRGAAYYSPSRTGQGMLLEADYSDGPHGTPIAFVEITNDSEEEWTEHDSQVGHWTSKEYNQEWIEELLRDED